MSTRPVLRSFALTVAALLVSSLAFSQAAAPQTKPFEPTVGQAGKDVVWVPTPQALVDKMLEMAKVTAKDIVYDLGCGDGRIDCAKSLQTLKQGGFHGWIMVDEWEVPDPYDACLKCKRAFDAAARG